MRAVTTEGAPAALGTYSQATVCGRTIYTAGQIGLDPKTMLLVDGAEQQIRRVIDNIAAICASTDCRLGDIARMTVYLVDASHWPLVNKVMAEYFEAPFPARTAVGVAWLPLGAVVEIEAVIVSRGVVGRKSGALGR